MKKILIIYQPGFGGHFLSYLFSLDSSVVPYVKLENNINERVKLYSFDNIEKKYGHWRKFHEDHDNTKEIPTSNFSTLVQFIHPAELYNNLEFYKKDYQEFYVVSLSYSDFANFWLVQTKHNWGNFPVLFSGGTEKEKIIIKELNPIEISIDCFLDKSTWKEEYIRINSLMNIPLQLKAAEELYQSWYNIRVLPLKIQFEKLSTDEKKYFLSKRLRDEQREPLVNHYSEPFSKIYKRIKAESWPECESEEDFYQLPDYIRVELIEKFNYKPKHIK